MFSCRSKFDCLPNEIVYLIFDYLSSNEIIESFVGLNQCLNDVVRCHVKKLDVTKGWSCDKQKLEWILSTIEILKIDRYHVDFLCRKLSMNLCMKKYKSLLRLIADKIFGHQQAIDQFEVEYFRKFPRINSIEFVNVTNWSKFICENQINQVSICFDDHIRHNPNELSRIPETVTRFSSNLLINPKNFHKNLVDLNICVLSIDDLIDILRYSPNVEHLSVKFCETFYYFHPTNYDFKGVLLNLNRLTRLTRLSIETKLCEDFLTNKYLNFNEIKYFIEISCPNRIKLKLKFHFILFDEQLCSTIENFKIEFIDFDFYGSFILDENLSLIEQLVSSNSNFSYHIENVNERIHIYSLPFRFDCLYGFENCSLLNRECSYTNVRSLYFTQNQQNSKISFQLLVQRMPFLRSIYFRSKSDEILSKLPMDEEKFEYLRRFYFKCDCIETILVDLLDRMPLLEHLTSSNEKFLRKENVYPLIKELNLEECQMKSFDLLPIVTPNLMNLYLNAQTLSLSSLFQLIYFLFTELIQLKLLSFKYISFIGKDPLSYRNQLERVLNLLKQRHHRFQQFKFETHNGRVIFCFQLLSSFTSNDNKTI